MAEAVKTFGIPMMVGGTNASITKQGTRGSSAAGQRQHRGRHLVKYIKDEMKLTRSGPLLERGLAPRGRRGGTLCEADGADVVAASASTRDRDFTAQLLTLKKAGPK